MSRPSQHIFLPLLLAASLVLPAYAGELATSPSPSDSSAAESAAAPLKTAETVTPTESGAPGEIVPVKEEARAPETTETPQPSKTAPVPVAAPKTALSHDEASRLWKFLKNLGKDNREEMMETTLFQLNQFLRFNADWAFSDEALQLKADLHMRRKEYKDAAVTYLKLIYEYPDSRLVFPARRALTDLMDKKFDKKYKPVLYEASKGSDAKDKRERLAQFLRKMTEQAGDGFYEQLVAEYDAFFCRFPAYPGTDELDVLLGHLHTKKEKYLTALTYYQKVLSTCPNSQFRSSAQRLIGDLYVTGLKDVNEAVNAYQDVINQYPNSEDAAYAYEQTARLEEQQTHFELAVDIYEKIVKVYPNKPVAARAFNGEARILNEQLKKPDEALAVYGRLADMFKGSEDAETALKTAAALARKQKNFNAEVSQYVRIARECATAKDAPDMLYQAAQIAEDDLTQNNRAVELYKELTEKFPDSKLAKKASGRIKALLGK